MDTKELIEYFADKRGLPYPIYVEQIESLLTRMISCGMITKKEADEYVEKCKRDDSRGNLVGTK